VTDSPLWGGRPVVLGLFAVSLCALVTAATLTVVMLAAATPEPCCPGTPGIAAGRPSPTAPSSSSRAAGLPMCLVGSWRTVEDTVTAKFYTDQPALPFTTSGTTYEFHPDGTGVLHQDNVVYNGSFRGNQLKIVGNGSIDFTWTADDKTITYRAYTRTALAYSYYDQRGPLSTVPVAANPNLNEVDDYTCQATQLAESNTALGYHSSWVRTSALGVYG
jgi:hypothetical protein